MTTSNLKRDFEELLNSSRNIEDDELITWMQDESSVNIVVAVINNFLTTPIRRDKGLNYLNCVLNQCSPSILNKHASFWMSICIARHPEETVNEIRFTTMAKIIHLRNDIQGYNMLFSGTGLAVPMEMCLNEKMDVPEKLAALLALKMFSQHYPGPCGPFKNKIETYVLKCLSKPFPRMLVNEAGRVYHYLQQAGGKGNEGTIHIDNWSKCFIRLCSTMYILYDKFLGNQPEILEYEALNIEPIKLDDILPNIDDEEVLFILANRLDNVTAFLNAMLLEKFPVSKNISVSIILEVIKRGLSVYGCFSKSNQSANDIVFCFLMSTHQINLLNLLRSVIACLQQNLMPFSFEITKLLNDCLMRTNENDYLQFRNKYKSSIYKVLIYWIEASKGSIDNSLHDKLLNFISHEITVSKDMVVLTNDVKERVQEHTVSNSGSRSLLRNQTSMHAENNEISVANALHTLICIIENGTLNVIPNTYSTIIKDVIKTLLDLQSGRLFYPYTILKCQVALFKTAVALLEQHATISAPIQIITSILIKGQNDKTKDISEICCQGLRYIEKISQPMCSGFFVKDNNTLLKQTAESCRDIIGSCISKNMTDSTSNDQEEQNQEAYRPKINIISIHVIEPCKIETTQPLPIQTRQLLECELSENIPIPVTPLEDFHTCKTEASLICEHNNKNEYESTDPEQCTTSKEEVRIRNLEAADSENLEQNECKRMRIEDCENDNEDILESFHICETEASLTCEHNNKNEYESTDPEQCSTTSMEEVKTRNLEAADSANLEQDECKNENDNMLESFIDTVQEY